MALEVTVLTLRYDGLPWHACSHSGKPPHAAEKSFMTTNQRRSTVLSAVNNDSLVPLVAPKRSMATRKHHVTNDTVDTIKIHSDTSKNHSNNSNQETKLPEIAPLSEEQRKLRDAEKVRQAQERARARLTRTHQRDQIEAEREIEATRQQVLRQERECAERERLVEQSRLRAEERVRTKRRLFSAAELPVGAEVKLTDFCPERPATHPAQLERFRRKTLARLQAYALVFTTRVDDVVTSHKLIASVCVCCTLALLCL